MADLNAVIQFIVKTQRGRGYDGMAAGSGWFYNHKGETVIITNAHVVNQATAVFIRLPADHNTNIRVYPVGISSDLDLAVCKLDEEGMAKVLQTLQDQYGVDKIPTLEMADSDSVHLKSFSDMKAPRVIARGYPHGTEYQQFTDGRVSGIKHANEQEYIVTTATIEPGNSGGPCVNEEGKVIGINSMKMTNATETNIIIPSNRVKRVLGELLNNSVNMNIIKTLLSQRQAMMDAIAMKFAGGQVKQLAEEGLEVDDVKINNVWEKHNLGGFKKDSSGRISRVSISDWYQKHVLHVDGSYSLFKKVMEHLHNDEPDEVVKMRKAGFKTFCKDASVQVEISEAPLLKQTPPRLLHMPRLGFRTNNANAAALEHYGQPHGVIVRDVVEGSVFDKYGIQRYDLVTHIDGEKVDNFGEVWNEKLNVSLPLKDMIHRKEFGEQVTLRVVPKNGGGEKSVSFNYSFLKDAEKPNIRLLETLQDTKHAKEVMTLPNGLVVKTLRLDDVYQMNLREYLQEHRQNDYRVVVCEILPGSDAFHTMNFRVGTVLGNIDGDKVADNWSGVCEQLSKAFAKEGTFAIESDKGRILFAKGVKPN